MPDSPGVHHRVRLKAGQLLFPVALKRRVTAQAAGTAAPAGVPLVTSDAWRLGAGLCTTRERSRIKAGRCRVKSGRERVKNGRKRVKTGRISAKKRRNVLIYKVKITYPQF